MQTATQFIPDEVLERMYRQALVVVDAHGVSLDEALSRLFPSEADDVRDYFAREYEAA